MKLLTQLKPANLKHYLLLALFGLVAYWPLTLNIFTLKNDAITYFLPWRYQISESIRNGYFPLWSPYLYTGLPLHADIQSGVWNPVVLIISLFTKYNMSILQWETLIYLIAAGVGFFKLCRFFSFGKDICLVLAVSYMCCGFMIDSGPFIPWITSAAYLPFVFLFFLRTLHVPLLRNTIKLTISCSLLFLAGYPSFFIFGLYILIIGSLTYIIVCLMRDHKKHAFQFASQLAIAGILTLLICSPALISYIRFFPYYSRGTGLSYQMAQTNPFALPNTISYVLPQASYKLSTANDISSRNAYVGIIPFLLIIYSVKNKWTAWQKTISVVTLAAFLFSLGDSTPVHRFFFHFFPFANSFRHPATMRIFTSTGLLVLSGFGLQRLPRRTDPALKTIAASFAAATLVYVVYLSFAGNAVRSAIRPFQLNISSISQLFDSGSFRYWAFVSAAVQFVFLLALLLTKQKRFVLAAASFNVIIIANLSMPFTLISQHRSKQINAFIATSPSGFPASLAWQDVEDEGADSAMVQVYGDPKFYNKRIAIDDHVITPTINTSYGQFLNDSAVRKLVSTHRFAYVDSPSTLSLLKFSPNRISFATANSQQGVVHITQQFNRDWKAYANGEQTAIQPDHVAFMKVSLPAGTNDLVLRYQPKLVIFAAYVSALFFFACIATLIYFRWTQK